MSACFGENELEGLKGSKMWAGYGLSNVTGFGELSDLMLKSNFIIQLGISHA